VVDNTQEDLLITEDRRFDLDIGIDWRAWAIGLWIYFGPESFEFMMFFGPICLSLIIYRETTVNEINLWEFYKKKCSYRKGEIIMVVKHIKCNECGKSASRYIIVEKEASKLRWCRNCSIRNGINFEVEYRKQTKSGVFASDRERIKGDLPPE
jgi:hypothetical protein